MDVKNEAAKVQYLVSSDMVMRHPDLSLQLTVREMVVRATEIDLTLDEALNVLKSEVAYIEGRIKNAN